MIQKSLSYLVLILMLALFSLDHFSPCLLFLFHAFWENKLVIYFLNNFKSLFIFGCVGSLLPCRLFSGEGNGTSLQYSCLANPMDGGAWWAAVHGVRRVGHGWATSLSLFTFLHWRRKWQPTPVFLPGESQGRGSLMGCRLWGRTESDMTEVT